MPGCKRQQGTQERTASRVVKGGGQDGKNRSQAVKQEGKEERAPRKRGIAQPDPEGCGDGEKGKPEQEVEDIAVHDPFPKAGCGPAWACLFVPRPGGPCKGGHALWGMAFLEAWMGGEDRRVAGCEFIPGL